MKNFETLCKELGERPDFQVTSTGIDGGMGVFTRGPMRRMTVIWSNSFGWEHVSVDGKKHTPDWDEMCQVKDMFFCEDECCIQYHPAKEHYVNHAPHCLHIWRPVEKHAGPLPVPPDIFV